MPHNLWSLCVLCVFFNWAKAGVIADRIVATVGRDIILASELKEAVDFLKTIQRSESLPESLFQKEALKRMIQEKLILTEAEKETVTVSRNEIEPELESAWRALIARFPSLEDFKEMLKKEGITERELKNHYYEEIRKKILAQKLLQKKGLLNVFISPLEVKKFYEENKDSIAYQPGRVSIAHIFLPITPSEEEERNSQRKIFEIYEILRRGADFEEVARSFSEDPKTAKSGGYLGKLKKGTLLPEIEKPLFSLKEGEFSLPFRSPAGYHILKCKKRRDNIIEANHILIRVLTTKEDSLRQRRLALRIREKSLRGERFDSLAKIYSQDSETKEKGGYIGEFYIEQLFPPFREVAERLKEGAISEPVLSENGFHLIKILAKEEPKVLSLEEMQNEIRNYLMEKKIQEKLEEYLSQIAERTYIHKF